jgi:hypothetical protein
MTSPTTCAICAEYVAYTERPNASTLQWVRRTRGAPREEPQRPRRRPVQSLSCVVRRASPAPSDQTGAHHGGHEERAELPRSNRNDDIAATCVLCVARADQTRAHHGRADQTRAHRGGHGERAELPGSNRNDDTAATCTSCVARAERQY